MLYTLSLLLLLTALAGVIAYAGDILGTTVGRRRLSLFGWRPKRTGQVVGVFVGILIMLTTIGILSVAFQDAASVLLRAQDIARELDTLRAQRESLQREVKTSRAQLEQAREVIGTAEAQRDEALGARDQAQEARNAALRDAIRLRNEQTTLRSRLGALRSSTRTLEARQQALEADNAALEGNNAALSTSNEVLNEQNAQLVAQNAAFQNTLNNLQNQVVTLNNSLGELRRESERRAQNLRETVAQLEAASGGELTYRRNDIVASTLIAKTPAGSLEALQAFVAEARQEVVARGASDVVVRGDQLAGLAQAIAESPGEDLVVLVASDNFVAPAPIRVNVEAYENLKLLAKGQLVASRQIHLGSTDAPVSRAAIRAEIARLTQESVDRLQRVGLFEQVRPTPTEAEFDGFTSWLARMSGPVMIGAVARAPIFRAGPAELEFVILW